MKYLNFVLAVTTVSIFFVIAPAQPADAKLTPVTIALNWKAEPEFGGFYAGQILNHYKSLGLDVKIQEGGSGTPTVQMLASGKIDFAIVSADEIIISQDRNKNNKVIALFATYQKSPYIIMTHAERGFKTLKDVWTSDGLLSMQSGLPYYQFLVNKWGKPTVKIVPYMGGVASFVNDKKFSQQGFISTEPVTAEKSGAKVKNFIIADEGFNPYLVVLATTEKVLKEKPELVQKLVQGTREGWQAYLTSPEVTNKHMAQINKSLDFETFQKGAELQKTLIQTSDKEPLGSMTKERWEILAKQVQELKLIKSKPAPSESYFR